MRVRWYAQYAVAVGEAKTPALLALEVTPAMNSRALTTYIKTQHVQKASLAIRCHAASVFNKAVSSPLKVGKLGHVEGLRVFHNPGHAGTANTHK